VDETQDVVRISAGSFIMGQAGIAIPEHEVTITNDYLIGRNEVTNEEFSAVFQWAYDNGYLSRNEIYTSLPSNGGSYGEIHFADDGVFYIARARRAGDWGYLDYDTYNPANHPVQSVSWFGAAMYCDMLSIMNNLNPYYNDDWANIPFNVNPYTAVGFRLPTEAEWEFAAQYNDDRIYPWGNSEASCQIANVCGLNNEIDLCLGWTNEIGNYSAGNSPLGLRDITGNVAEWCNDWYDYYNSLPIINPIGPAQTFSGGGRVTRGEGWFSYHPGQYSIPWRNCVPPSSGSRFIGFRVCRTLID
jgi:formylglycine-generating enzyme required for sulfatase activity